jgi:hypothetical protein
MWLRFTPDEVGSGSGSGSGSGAECCQYFSFPLHDPGDDSVGFMLYSHVVFGVTVTVRIGGAYDPEVPRSCKWIITATGPGVDITKEWYVYDEEGSGSGSGSDGRGCLDPSDIEIGYITGPDGCTGMLEIVQSDVARLPFILRTAATAIISTTGSGSAFTHFVDVECGDCTQVCRVLCLTGTRTFGGDLEMVEFEWFDEGGSGSGSGGAEIQGWQSAGGDRIWLKENEQGECYLDFDWPGTGADQIPDTVIDLELGCSCGIKHVVGAGSGANSLEFTLRCGYCTCWKFYCGTCRCLPRTLCAMGCLNDTPFEEEVLSWDSDVYGWVSDEMGSGSGSGGPRLAVYVEADDQDRCIMVPELNGVSVGIENGVLLDCGTEHQSNAWAPLGQDYDPSNDFVGGDIFVDLDGDFVWMAWGNRDECRLNDCEDATPCWQECGSHPLGPLTALLRGWNDSTQGDEEGFDDIDISVEVELYFYERYYWADDDQLRSECGYRGVLYVGECPNSKYVIVEMGTGADDLLISTWFSGDETPIVRLEENLDESCDPYYGELIETSIGVTMDCPWACPPNATIQRWEATVTE